MKQEPMFNLIINLVGRRRVTLLITISFLFLTEYIHAQKNTIDTTAFKKDLEILLRKYGLNSSEYLLNVISFNQKGGQTALVITNNYYRDTIKNEDNFKYRVFTEGNEKILEVYPRTGMWITPFVITDTTRAKRRFFEPASGIVTTLAHIQLHMDGKTYESRGVAQDQPCSRTLPLYIYLDKADPLEFFVFGDFADPLKHYLYYKGKIVSIPFVDDR